MFVSGMMN